MAIIGGSYGGYAALAGVDVHARTRSPARVDIVGPSNLVTLLEVDPAVLGADEGAVRRSASATWTTKDEEFLIKAARRCSRRTRSRCPLLIGQGANDPRVKQAESEQIVEAIEKNGKPVKYVLYPDEGHGFARPENRMNFYARAEAFLAEAPRRPVRAAAGRAHPGLLLGDPGDRPPEGWLRHRQHRGAGEGEVGHGFTRGGARAAGRSSSPPLTPHVLPPGRPSLDCAPLPEGEVLHDAHPLGRGRSRMPLSGAGRWGRAAKQVGKGEGEVSIVAWAGYIERGETDKSYDWVTDFEKETGCKVSVKTAATSDEMVALMNEGGFDLVTASGDASLRLIARQAGAGDQHRR